MTISFNRYTSYNTDLIWIGYSCHEYFAIYFRDQKRLLFPVYKIRCFQISSKFVHSFKFQIVYGTIEQFETWRFENCTMWCDENAMASLTQII